MAIEILMPALSPTMTEGNLVKWLKKEGDKLKSGDVIAEIETDKATMEVESIDEGVLGKILVHAGTENVKVNTLIALILEAGEEVSSLASYKAQSSVIAEKVSAPTSVVAPAPTSAKKEASGSVERIFASPLARRIAGERSIDLAMLKGSGPRGRIVKSDVEQVSSSGSSMLSKEARQFASGSFVDLPISSMRKVVAKRLSESKQTVPHFYVSMDVEIDALLAMRKRLNDGIDQKVSVNDFLIKACARALIDVPTANSSWMETHVRQYQTADISVAVAIEGGLITPIVAAAEQKSLREISGEMKDLAERARAGKLAPQEFQGGNFTISNMGMYGVSGFSAIINPPQGAILAVGAGIEKPVVKNGTIQPATVMTLTLSSDHRVIDGAVAAEFLKALKSYIENPVLILA